LRTGKCKLRCAEIASPTIWDDLPLRKGVDRRYLRLALIGALSWALFWFKKERDTPAAIAKQMLLLLRGGVDDTKLKSSP